MSDTMFVLDAALVGALLVLAMIGLGGILAWIEPMRDHRLQRRLEARLARGSDRYFEELRSIETRIAERAAPGTVPASPFTARLFRPIAIVALWVFGGILLRGVLPDAGPYSPPGWTVLLYDLGTPFIALSMLIDPGFTERPARIVARSIAACLLVVSTLSLAREVARFDTVAASPS